MPLRSLLSTASKLAAVAMCAACPAPLQAQTVLRAVMNSDLKIIDPVWSAAFVVRDHGYLIYDTLFATDANGAIQPQMVDRTEVSADKLTYRFTLRDGLRWHDGQPVTADDCVASIKRWGMRDTMGQKLMSFVEDVTATDVSTIELKLLGGRNVSPQRGQFAQPSPEPVRRTVAPVMVTNAIAASAAQQQPRKA